MVGASSLQVGVAGNIVSDVFLSRSMSLRITASYVRKDTCSKADPIGCTDVTYRTDSVSFGDTPGGEHDRDVC